MGVGGITFITILAICITSIETQNKWLLTVDWNLANESCDLVIKNALKMVNLNNETNLVLQNTSVCTSQGTIMPIKDCEHITTKRIEIISYFFSLPENDELKQCECQIKCLSIHVSYYTIKFVAESQTLYFTTQNPCVAFCNKGYEIYLTSYAVNSYPVNGLNNLVKPFDTDCYNCLDNKYSKSVQTELIKIQLCDALMVCGILIDQYTYDIEAIETFIYGETIDSNHIMDASQMYWNKVIPPECDRCTKLKYDNTQKECIIKHKNEHEKICVYETATLVNYMNEKVIISYVSAISATYACYVNDLVYGQIKNYAADTLECICRYYNGEFQFSSHHIEDMYRNTNDRSTVFGSKNYFIQSMVYDMSYPHFEYQLNSCECVELQYIYDYLCTQPMYSVCDVSNSSSRPIQFSSIEEKEKYILSVYANPPNLILGYLSAECDHLNRVCVNADSENFCAVKLYTAFEYPIVQVINSYVSCVHDYNFTKNKINLSYVFKCPVHEACDIKKCTTLAFAECSNDDKSLELNIMCTKYDSECILACPSESASACIYLSQTGNYSVASNYDLCVQRCSQIAHDIVCDVNSINVCKIPICEQKLCKLCRQSKNERECQLTCEALNAYFPENCTIDECDNKNNEVKNICVFSHQVSVAPFLITDYDKCVAQFNLANNHVEYKSCAACHENSLGCCREYCSSESDISIFTCRQTSAGVKAISNRDKCLYLCHTGTSFDVLLTSCQDVCSYNCIFNEPTSAKYCLYDTLLTQKCISSLEYCEHSCKLDHFIAADCSNISDDKCLFLFCRVCREMELSEGVDTCPYECVCAFSSFSEFKRCTTHMRYCEQIVSDKYMICVDANAQNIVLHSKEQCIHDIVVADTAHEYTCDICESGEDCCVKACEKSALIVCVKYMDNLFYTTRGTICEQACLSRYYQELQSFDCCVELHRGDGSELCTVQNNTYVAMDLEAYCNASDILSISSINIVEYSFCCLQECNLVDEGVHCVYENGAYVSIEKQTFCNRKCILRSNTILVDAIMCCGSACNSRLSELTEGTYCDRMYRIYDSKHDICYNGGCKSDASDIVLCSTSIPCTEQICKEQWKKYECLTEVPKPVAVIYKDGNCAYSESHCTATANSDSLLYSHDCLSPNSYECLQSETFYKKYISVVKSDIVNSYCHEDMFLSQVDYSFKTKCLKLALSNIKACNGANCDSYYCKKTYCSKACGQTASHYWATDCKYYQSQCETDCLDLKYFDFTDVIKYTLVCGTDDSFRNGIELINLQLHTCLVSTGLVMRGFHTDGHNNYKNCSSLGSSDIADCRNRCSALIATSTF